MKPIARASLWVTLSFLVVVLVIGAVGVYGFNVYERAWGRGPSFQVMTWVAIPLSVVVGLVATFGFLVSRSELRRPRTLGVAVGVANALALVVSEMLLPSDSELSGLPRTFALLLLVFVVAIFAPRAFSRDARVA